MHIIGGTYLEHVNEPYWHEIFGSGLRAASIISSVCNSITLSTYLSEDEALVVEAKSEIFGFHLMPKKREQSISFSYFHGFSRPHISPHISQIQRGTPIFIDTDECILRFGMVEGDAVVRGKTVVYDPQSAFLPAPFHENGSRANRLAIILNAGEAFMLTKERSVSSAGEVLAGNTGAEVVIIKRGPLGCIIFSKKEMTSIHAYRTARVFPIGSGDVFAATFAHYWGEKGLDANEAADHASMATAHFCNFQNIPLPKNYKDEANFPAVTGAVEGKQVYLAGPFFTTAQRWLIEECLQSLQRAGVKVFSPYHSVGIGSGDDIYLLDIEGLEKSDVIFACLDGLDSGTIYEVGYAKAIGKQVVVFVQNESNENLKMITGAGCRICSDLVTALYEVVWTLMGL